MKKILFLFLFSFLFSCEPVFTFAQCPAPLNVNIDDVIQGVNGPYDGIGLSFEATGAGFYSIEINGVYYTTPEKIKGRIYVRAVYPLSPCCNGIITACNVWQFYKVAPFNSGQQIVVSIVTYNSFGVVCGRSDYIHTVAIDLCRKGNK